jgi:hypothetical protein
MAGISQELIVCHGISVGQCPEKSPVVQTGLFRWRSTYLLLLGLILARSEGFADHHVAAFEVVDGLLQLEVFV